MQAPCQEAFSSADLFSRERRQQRMLHFLETFDRRSWSGTHEATFIVPVSRPDLREAVLAEYSPALR